MNYKNKFLIVLVMMLAPFITKAQKKFEWNRDKKIQQKQNREDSSKWDKNNFVADSASYARTKKGFFPVPKYDLVAPNSFDGLGYGGSYKGDTINGKKFVHNFYYVNNCLTNQEFVGNKKDEVFFCIISLTDFVDERRFTHMSSGISSRNHPDYLAEGFIKTKDNTIQYAAFITGDRQAYAIVNSRIFDLNLGRIIVIVPQKDHSLRSFQINIPIVSSEEIKKYIAKVLNRPEIVRSYTSKGSI
ncbi:MAG: hypothetical protein H7Y04_12680 [Verrucomicrobia bacterium]|nr:hypothetical protein [Cytophagales bacterium]